MNVKTCCIVASTLVATWMFATPANAGWGWRPSAKGTVSGAISFAGDYVISSNYRCNGGNYVLFKWNGYSWQNTGACGTSVTYTATKDTVLVTGYDGYSGRGGQIWFLTDGGWVHVGTTKCVGSGDFQAKFSPGFLPAVAQTFTGSNIFALENIDQNSYHDAYLYMFSFGQGGQCWSQVPGAPIGRSVTTTTDALPLVFLTKGSPSGTTYVRTPDGTWTLIGSYTKVMSNNARLINSRPENVSWWNGSKWNVEGAFETYYFSGFFDTGAPTVYYEGITSSGTIYEYAFIPN